jgi:hypothetical protein
MDRRGFLKLLGGVAALPVVGKYLKFAKPVAETIEQGIKSLPEGMPSYFFDLVNGVKKFGKKISEGRDEIVYQFKDPKSGKQVEVVDGRTETQINFETDKGSDASMSLIKGEADEMTKGVKPPDEYMEGEMIYKSEAGGTYSKDMTEEIKGGKEGLEKLAERFKTKKANGGTVNTDLTTTIAPAKGPDAEGVASLFERR